MNKASVSLEMLLSSKTVMDTVETIEVYKTLHQFGFGFAEAGVNKML